MVLIPLVTSQIKVPLIAAGGFYDGRGLAAALVLGADAVSMGTRFILTQECDVHNNFKQLCLRATEQDTLYSDVFDGLPGRALKSPGAEAMMKGGFSFFRSLSSALEVKRILHLPFWKFVGLSWSMLKSEQGKNLLIQARAADGAIHHLKAIQEGNEKEGFMFAGQSVGGIKDIPGTRELIERIVDEAEKRLEAVNSQARRG
jgi:enoyl-[acyl-carrier protein] reductase II